MHPDLKELLTLKIDFLEKDTTGEDDRGNKTGGWIPKYSNVPCRLDFLGGRENKDGREVTLRTYRCFTDADITIVEGNQGRQGTDTFEITAVGKFFDEFGEPDHLEIMMEKVDQSP